MTRAIEALTTLYEGPAARALYDEVVTEHEHALQCAALARAEGQPDLIVAAALLHDVGHLLPEPGPHEEVGAAAVSRWFGPEVTEPVRLHVRAKRYLVATEAGYPLSPSSRRSLVVQGGPLSAAEVAAFEAEPGFAAAVLVRRYDEAAKVPGVTVPPLASYLPLLARLLVRGT